VCGYTFCTSGTSLADLCASILYSLEQEYLLLKSVKYKNTKVEFTLDLKVFKARLETEIIRQKPGTIAAEFVAGLATAYHSAGLVGLSGINVVIDEIDELDQSINIGRFFKAAHETLQQQRIDDITFTLTGQRGVFQRLFREEPAVERIFRHLLIPTLEPEEARHILAFASEHAEDPFVIESEAQEMMLALATGHPYAVHLLGNAGFNRMEDPKVMTRNDVLRGIGDLLQSDKAEKYVVRLRDVTNAEKIVLISMSLYASTEIPMQIPSRWIAKNLLGALPSGNTLQKTLDELIVRDYVVEGPARAWYRFRDELFRIFLSHSIFSHREREDERLAQRRQELDSLIDRERKKELKPFLPDYREYYRALYKEEPPLSAHSVELLNVSNFELDWDYRHLERADLLALDEESSEEDIKG
jgi:hypothetical protein